MESENLHGPPTLHESVHDHLIIPIEIQWVGSAPWFCKYKTGAWPPEWSATITKSRVPDLCKPCFYDKIKAEQPLL